MVQGGTVSATGPKYVGKWFYMFERMRALVAPTMTKYTLSNKGN